MHPDEHRIVHLWRSGILVETMSFPVGASWRNVGDAPLRVRDDPRGVAVDVGALEPLDVYVAGSGLVVPTARPVVLEARAILLVGPGPCGTYAVQLSPAPAREKADGKQKLEPLRVSREDAQERRRRTSEDTTRIELGIEVALPDGRRFHASPTPLSDDDVAAWLDATGRAAPLKWPDRYGSAPAVGLGPEEAAAAAHHHGGRLPSEEEWDALARTPGIDASVGEYWEWTSTQRRDGGFVVRGGRFRDRRDVRGGVASRAWEDEGARDIVVRVVRDLSS